MQSTEKQALLLLNRQRGIGPRRFMKLMQIFGTATAFWEATREDATLLPKLLKKNWHAPDYLGMEQDTRWEAESSAHHILTLDDPAYPSVLKEIPDPPYILYVKGNVAALQKPQIAVVGSRNASVGGCEDAFRFSAAFAEAGFVVTSGLALGIDAAAHQGTLRARGETIAVLAHGLDSVYPTRHQSLAAAILKGGGALVSEFPIGISPDPSYFPRRNRIISGLVCAVLVVEAAERSGSLITARLASEFGREVFAIPGSIHHTQSRGCHHLIRQGATLVDEPAQLLETIGVWHHPLSTQIKKEAQHLRLDGVLMKLLQALGSHPTSVDALVESLHRSAEGIAGDLMNLEILGLVRQVPGGYQRKEEV